MSELIQDVRYAFRSLARAPGFTLVALLTLALGIGGTTAIFSVVDGILLRPLPFPDADRVVRVVPRTGNSAGDAAFSPADFLDYKEQSHAFAALAAYRADAANLSGRGDPIRLPAIETTGAFFDVFAVPPLAGRTFNEKLDPVGSARVAVISEHLWETQFGRDAAAIGSVVRLNGVPMTVVGIMPKGFEHPIAADAWILAEREVPSSPLAVTGDLIRQREVQYFQAIGRLRSDVTLERARSELRTIGDRLAQQYPDTNAGEAAVAIPLQEFIVGGVRTALLVMLGAVACVLLIACANVASLLLARGAGRRRELAVRSALGAGSGRLLRQLLTESVVLAGAGGIAGLLVAYWGVDALVAMAPASIPRLADVHLDPRVMAFAIATSAVVGILFGLAPAVQAARTSVAEALKDGGRTGTARTGARSVLVVAEVALCLMLLIVAGLMVTSFARLRLVDPGFNVQSLMLVSVPLPQARYNTPAQVRFFRELYDRVTTNDVTRQAALVFPPPFGGANAAGSYSVEGKPPRGGPDRDVAQISSVSPGFFRTMGIPLLKGRDLTFDDGENGRPVAIVNRTLAEREWPGEDPVGKRIVFGGDPNDANSLITIVGVVGDSKRQSLDAPIEPTVYFSLAQFTFPFMAVVVKTDAGETAVASALRSSVTSIDPEVPIDSVRTVERVLERTTGQPRFRATLIAAFALAALLLASVGLYGLISYTVAQRVPELGVRLALGARPSQLARMVIASGLRLCLIGVALGLAGALAVTRVLRGLLFAISVTDPVIYTGVAALLLLVATLACYIPARRAMRIDPVTALRAE